MCPQCKKPVLAARVEAIQLYSSDGESFNGVKYSCISCGSVLSVGIDFLAQKNDIVKEILAGLGRA
jgi:ribosomal protein S27AE